MKNSLMIAVSAFAALLFGITIYQMLTRHQRPYVITNLSDDQVLSGDFEMQVSAPQYGNEFLRLWMDGKPHDSMILPWQDLSGNKAYRWVIPTSQYANGRHTLGVGYGAVLRGTKDMPFDTRTVIFNNPKAPAPGKRGKA